MSSFDMQEVEKKARKQFKGLFDKKPGEIAVAGSEDKEDNDTGENPNNFDKEDSDADNSEESREAEADADQMGWFSRIWPTGGRLFSALGLQRCSILWFLYQTNPGVRTILLVIHWL